MTDPRRAIPGVDRLLSSEAFAGLVARTPRRLLLDEIQAVVAEVRSSLDSGTPGSTQHSMDWYAERVRARLATRERQSLRRVINATGVVLHTNLGRAPLADVARDAMLSAATSYSNLELDLDSGERGSRYVHCAALLRELTGAEDALVVNNNAAAVVLALNTLAAGRDALVSRGELVEIGGAFRVPEVMARSGARMVEVGSTNRTYVRDYEAALGAATAVILKVHQSNFRISGFTAEASLAELAALADANGVVLMNDLGSGLLIDLSDLDLPHEPTPTDALRAGAHVVTMSGDKLLGGPQAGIILGHADMVARMRANPLCRALRVDKLTLAALEATLVLYREPERARREIPVLRMLTMSAAEISERAGNLAAALGQSGIVCETVTGRSAVGGGAFPGGELPTTLVAVESANVSADALERRLREGSPPVIARIVEDRVVIDPRTVLPGEETALVAAIAAAAGSST